MFFFLVNFSSVSICHIVHEIERKRERVELSVHGIHLHTTYGSALLCIHVYVYVYILYVSVHTILVILLSVGNSERKKTIRQYEVKKKKKKKRPQPKAESERRMETKEKREILLERKKESRRSVHMVFGHIIILLFIFYIYSYICYSLSESKMQLYGACAVYCIIVYRIPSTCTCNINESIDICIFMCVYASVCVCV